MSIESLFIQAFCIVVVVMLAGCAIEKKMKKIGKR